MNHLDLCYLPIAELAEAFEQKILSPLEYVRLLRSRIERLNPRFNLFLSLNPELEQAAAESERRWGDGSQRSSYEGVPFSVKDLILTREIPTTAGSRAFGDGIRTDSNGPVVARLQQLGMLLLGKTHLHECAYGITNENAHFGPARNPWDPTRMTGGSSGGSAGALAAGMGPVSLGTDTRGSIRIPSACCGTTGLKPTFGRIPVQGVLPLSPKLDHIGPMARSAADVECLFRGLLGARSVQLPPVHSVSGIRMGLAGYFFRGLSREVESAVGTVLRLFEQGGVDLVEVKLNGMEDALDASDVISKAEAVATHHENLLNRPDRFDPKVRDRMIAGYDLNAVDLVRALQVRRRCEAEFEAAFQHVDCIAAAGLPVEAPLLGTERVELPAGDEPIVRCFVRLHAPQNMARVPAMVFPCGLSTSGLPLSFQLIGRRENDELLLRLGRYYQQQTDWHLQRPKAEIHPES